MDLPDSLPAGQYVIYALVDPTDQLVYYVGQTQNPKQRMIGHLSVGHNPGKKAEWVRSLTEKGQKPLMQILEMVVDAGMVLAKEQEWIRHFVGQGMPLLNAQVQPKLAEKVMRSTAWERRILSPVLPGVEFEFMRTTIPAGVDAGVFAPHAPGSREYVAVEQGVLLLTLDDISYTLAAGDSIYCAGDCRHAYANPGQEPLVYYLAMDVSGIPPVFSPHAPHHLKHEERSDPT
jgi:quercetin dioxygenase-like cupin family protein